MCSIKRGNSIISVLASSFLLDVEGTTTSISFVKDELFPYIRKHLREYVEEKWKSTEIKNVIEALKSQAKEDAANKVEGVVAIPDTEDDKSLMDAVVDNVLWQMDQDKKTKSLKELQGLIMEEGYTKGELKGHIYDDVEPSLKDWAAQNKSMYIYSSGSVQAQKLLFGHSVNGDLLPLIKGHFDTTVGMKGEMQSYKNILTEISCDPAQVAFLTDVPKEARAAKAAGITAVLVCREGNTPLTDEDIKEFPVITTFEEIEFENTTSKKAKLSEENDVNDSNKQVSTCSVSLDNTNLTKPAADEDEKMEVDEIPDEKNIATPDTKVGESKPLQEPMKEVNDESTAEKTLEEKSSNDSKTPEEKITKDSETPLEKSDEKATNENIDKSTAETEVKKIDDSIQKVANTEEEKVNGIETETSLEKSDKKPLNEGVVSDKPVADKTEIKEKMNDEKSQAKDGNDESEVDKDTAEVKTVVVKVDDTVKTEPKSETENEDKKPENGVDEEKSVEAKSATEDAALESMNGVVPNMNGASDKTDEKKNVENDETKMNDLGTSDIPDLVKTKVDKTEESSQQQVSVNGDVEKTKIAESADVASKLNGEKPLANGELEKDDTIKCVNGKSSPTLGLEATNGKDAAEQSSKGEKKGDPAVSSSFEVEA